MKIKFAIITLLLGIMSCSMARSEDMIVLCNQLKSETELLAQSAQVIGNELYFIANGYLFLYDMESENLNQIYDFAEKFNHPNITTSLFSDGSELFVLSNDSQCLYRVDGKNIVEIMSLDTSKVGNVRLQLVMPVVTDGYIMALHDKTGYGLTFDLVIIDLSTGIVETSEIEGIYSITSYKEDKVLAYIRDDEKGGEICVLSNDGAQSETVLALEDTQKNALAYNPQNEKIYYWEEGYIKSIDEAGNIQKSGVLNQIYVDNVGYSGIAHNGAFVTLNKLAGIVICPLSDDFQDIKQIKISGKVGSVQALYKASTALTDINILWDKENAPSMEDVAKKMIEQDSTADIYALSTLSNMRTLIERGYAEELSLPSIHDAFNRMYPQVSAYLMDGGRVYAIPSYIKISCIGVNKELAENMGFEFDSQMTMADYLESYKRWTSLVESEEFAYDVGAEFYQEGVKVHFGMMLIAQYLLSTKDGDPDFEDDQFVDMLNLINGFEEGTDSSIIDLRESCFDSHYQFYVRGSGDDYLDVDVLPWPLFDESSPRSVRAEMGIYILNPYSKNKDAAKAVMAELLNCMPEIEQYFLYPDEIEPVEHEDYEDVMDYLSREKNELEDLLIGSDEERSREISAELDRINARIEDVEAKERWAFSPDEVEKIKTLAPALDYQPSVYQETLLGTNREMTVDILKRFFSGNIDSAQTVKLLNEKSKMIMGESI